MLNSNLRDLTYYLPAWLQFHKTLKNQGNITLIHVLEINLKLKKIWQESYICRGEDNKHLKNDRMKRDFGKNGKKQSPIYSKLLTISYKKRCHLPFIPLRKLRHNSILSVESLLVAKGGVEHVT